MRNTSRPALRTSNPRSFPEIEKDLRRAYNQQNVYTGRQTILAVLTLAAKAEGRKDEGSNRLATIDEIREVADAVAVAEVLPALNSAPLDPVELRDWFEYAITLGLTKTHMKSVIEGVDSGEYKRLWKREDRYDDKKVRGIFWRG
jgi:hypothetical protein